MNTELAPPNVAVGTTNAMISADEDLSLLDETNASDSSKAYLHLRPLRITKVTTKIYWNGYKYNRINKARNGFECTYSSKTKSHDACKVRIHIKFQYDKSIMLTRNNSPHLHLPTHPRKKNRIVRRIQTNKLS